MKEKIKNYMFYGLITYSILIITLTILNITNMNKIIEVSDSYENLTKINNLKSKIETLPENACKTLLNDMIKSYENTSFMQYITNDEKNQNSTNLTNTKLNEIYWEGSSFLSYYQRVINDCNINEGLMKSLNMPFYFVNSTSFIDNLVSKKMFDYELKIKDIWMRELAESNRMNMDYKLSKQNEIIIIENILNNMGGNINE